MDDQPERLDQALGLAIRLRRQTEGITQSELGQAIGVSFQQVQKYERGLNRVSFSMLARISSALHCSIAEVAAEALALAEARVEAGSAEPLTQPEAAPILEALTRIQSASARRAVLHLARDLARED